MTLLATEIHNHDDPDQALIVFAADRRITTRAGKYRDTRGKIFKLPWLNAGIGYFGLAELPRTRGMQPMEEWLGVFILKNVDCRILEEFAQRLATALNTAVPKPWRKTERSGFHIAGFNQKGQPEFWFVRNIDDNGEPTLGDYQAQEEFQRRDVAGLPKGAFMTYRNGDIRAHEAAWQKIDDSFGKLLERPDFRKLRSPEDYTEWVRFKMKLIAYFYKQYHPKPVIAKPIDAFPIRRKKMK